MQFAVMSRESCKNWSYLPHKEKSLVISISDTWAMPNKIKVSKENGIQAVLYLHFDDVDYDNKGQFFGMNESDAVRIVDFINKYKERVDKIVVHCNAGVSRSAGVCAAISKFLTGSDDQFFNGQYRPNMFCYRKVLSEFFKQEV